MKCEIKNSGIGARQWYLATSGKRGEMKFSVTDTPGPVPGKRSEVAEVVYARTCI